ncbi:hypothetical protein PSYAR_15567, partial [Pseudomonas syringae pv. aceris str. M302273]
CQPFLNAEVTVKHVLIRDSRGHGQSAQNGDTIIVAQKHST